jgi:N-acetyl-gamma-glutamyl-phosphate reductase
MHARIAILGASGYAGLELLTLLARHPDVEVAVAGSDRFAGATVESLCGVGGSMVFMGAEAAARRAETCDAVLLATPAEASLALVPRLAGTRVIDLSGAFRFADGEVFRAAYALAPVAHAAVYGLPELNRDAIAKARLVANPGCYPTAAALALGPLLAAGAIDRDVIVDAMSGVTGAGRKADEGFSFVELAGDARAYRVLRHQHAPEIAQTLAAYACGPVELAFTPHLVPIRRGILATSYARATAPTTSAALTQLLRHAYRGERFVRVADSPDEVSLARVVGTNDCLVGVAALGTRVVVTSAIDNLVKGAAGQAVQNLNLVLGLEEASGLADLRRLR